MPKSFLRQQAAVAFCACLLILCPLANAQGQSAASVQVRIAPPSLQVPEGGTVDVAVEVREVEALYGADVAFTFDPDVVEVVDADSSQDGVQVALGLFLDPGFVLRNLADNVQGKVHFAMTQLNPSEAKSGSGVLIVVKLRGKRAGASTLLTMVSAQLASRNGVSIPTTTADGRVEVVAVGTTGATNTPIPSQGAGTPLPTSTVRPTEAFTATPLPRPTETSRPAVTPAPASPTALPTPSPSVASSIATPTDTPLPTVQPGPSVTATVLVPTETAVLAVVAEPTATVTPASVSASSSILSTPAGNTDSQPAAAPTSTDRTLLGAGLVLLALATLLVGGLGAVWWVRRSKAHGRGDPS